MTIIFSYTLGQWSVSHKARISSRFKFVNRVHARVTCVICYVSISCLHSEYLLHDVCVSKMYMCFRFYTICVRYDAIFVLPSFWISIMEYLTKTRRTKMRSASWNNLAADAWAPRLDKAGAARMSSLVFGFPSKLCMAQWLLFGCFQPPKKCDLVTWY